MSFSLLNDDTPIDPDDELLVAYVDGELDNSSRSEVEDRLLADDSFRTRLQELQRGWDMLDDFPDAAPSERLVESTLELVVADLVKGNPRPKQSFEKWRLPVLVSFLCLLAATLTLTVIYFVRDRGYRQELADLAIAESLDSYFYGHDLQLMRDLSLNESWTKMALAMKEIGDFTLTPVTIASVSIDQRESAIESLSLARRSQLDAKWNRFVRLNPADQARIRQTATAVQADPNSKQLLETMQLYAAWRETLSNELRDRIESSDISIRRDAIKEAIDLTQLAMSKRSGVKLSDETIERIGFALRRILQQRIADRDDSTLRLMGRLNSVTDKERADWIAIGAMMVSEWGRSGGRPPITRPFGERPTFERVNPLTNDELAMIELMLTDDDREVLNIVAGDPRDPMIESLTLRTWAEETVRRKIWFRPNESPKLSERYEQLDDHSREIIDLLSPNEFLERLTRPPRR